MRKFLYKDLYDLENIHWWHKAKRYNVSKLLKKYTPYKTVRLKMVDIGCGTGKNIEELSAYGQVYGLDISDEALQFCQKRGIKNVKKGNAEKTGFEKNSFDVITLLDVLEHTDQHKTLLEMKRILKPDGYVIITVPAYKWLWSQWDVVLHHKRRYTKKSLTTVLKEHNFSIIKMSYMFSFILLPVFLIRLVKSKFSDSYSSDFQMNSSITNFICLFASYFESSIMRYHSIPFGTSIICIAKNDT